MCLFKNFVNEAFAIFFVYAVFRKKSLIKFFHLDGHDGFFFEIQDIYSKYLRRPKALDELCFSQFAKMFRTKGSENQGEECEEEILIDFQDQEMDQENIFDKFNFVMTIDISKKQKLPLRISLERVFPGESSEMRKRQFPAALRFHKKYNATDPQRFMLSEVMLYYPHKTEISLENAPKFYEEFHNGQRKVDIVKKQVMEYLEDVTEARYFVEEILKEVDFDETNIALDPSFVQQNDDCIEEGIEEHPDYEHMNPDFLDQINEEDEKSIKSIYPRIELQSLDVLKEKTRNLDEYQRHVVDIGIKYSKDVVKARNSLCRPPDPIYLMVDGGAGSGKSTVINVLAQWVQFLLLKAGDNPDCPYVLKVAPTGTAASYIDGQTLHTAFSFSFDGKPFSLTDKARDHRREALKNLKMVSTFCFLISNITNAKEIC